MNQTIHDQSLKQRMQGDTTPDISVNQAELRSSRLTDSQKKAMSRISLFTFVIGAACCLDLYWHWSTPDWRGLSTGVLGGIIGIFPSIYFALIDKKRPGMNDAGREPAKDEHVTYLVARLTIGIPSGFVLSSIVASFVPHATSACLTGFGIVGGFSLSFLPAIDNAVNRSISKYLPGNQGDE